MSELRGAAFDKAYAAKELAYHQAVQHRVRIAGAEFQPSKLKIRVGDSVLWINDDVVPHTATASIEVV